jgi:hypothetical protein
MERPISAPSFEPDMSDTLQRISIPKALRFTITPSKDKVELLDYAIKHIFVPPRLPNRADGTPQLESALLGLVRDCAEGFRDRLEPGSDAHTGWKSVCTMLATSAKLHDGELTEDSIKTAIAAMVPGGKMDLLVLYYPH